MAEPDSDELLDLLFTTFAAFRQQLRGSGQAALGPSHHMLLWRLKRRAESGVPSRVTDIAGALHLTPAAVTQLVDELVRRGLVQRHRDERDRRAVLVDLTEAGSALLADQRQRRRSVVQDVLAALEPEERETLLRILRRLGEGRLGGRPPTV